MSLATVLALINQEIVPNNNNEITANILRPILIEMLQQPNELIGVLSNLTTNSNTNLVDAINELKNDFTQINGVTIFQGIGNPNNNSLLTPSIVDFYSEINNLNNIVGLWIYTGVSWVSLSSNTAVLYTPQTLNVLDKQTARDNIDVYSKPEVDSAIATATKVFTKAVFEHTLTASDVANTIMTFALTHTPKMDEWEFLFIGSAPVSPGSYSVSGNTLSIDTSTIGYPMQAGRLLIFRYMY